MVKLNALLARYVATPPKMGPAAPFPADALRRDLESLLRSNSIYFTVIFTLLVILLLLSVGLLAYYLDQPGKAAAVIAATGISIPYLLRTMLRMWETKTHAEALLAMAATMEAGMLRTVVTTLSRTLMTKRLW